MPKTLHDDGKLLEVPNLTADVLERACSAEAGLRDPVDYETYHRLSRAVGDCDPAYEMLRYLCDRFELNVEQRYWLAFLYASCYQGATVYFIYNEFPDAENVHNGRMRRWWDTNRARLSFQSDRRWLRSRNQWCDVVADYLRRTNATGGQEAFFRRFGSKRPQAAYMAAYEGAGEVYQFGRYSLFLYLEAVHVVTGFRMAPDRLDFAESSAESSRNGWAFAAGRKDLVTHGTDRKLTRAELAFLQSSFDSYAKAALAADPTDTIWSLETTLCAYKKYRIGKRYVGYYLDRQAREISTMETAVREGVAWRVLWDYRRETYAPRWLVEARG